MSTSVAAAHQEKLKVLDQLFHGYNGPNFAVRLWDGSGWRFTEQTAPVSTIVFENESALRALFVNPNEITLGEAYIHNDVNIEGDLFAIFDVVEYILSHWAETGHSLLYDVSRTSLKFQNWLRETGRHSRDRDREAISYHYDQPAAFYRLFLGETMAYSCAYFESEEDSLDQAQENKFELICRKLRLKPLERMLDIGCGWGGLIVHAAARHGAFARGITLSQRQYETAVKRIQDANLTESCVAELRDYRSMEDVAPVDKISSVGMFEHVGRKNLPQYFGIAYRLLKPGGVFLNHGIAQAVWHHPRAASFIERFVFPDGELVSISDALTIAENAGFEVRDVENLREHYERTLRLWVEYLQENRDAALKLVSTTTYRIWLLYMAACAAAFKRGNVAVYQSLLSRPERGAAHLPLTRRDLFEPTA